MADWYSELLNSARQQLVRLPDGTYVSAPQFGQATSIEDIYAGILPKTTPAPLIARSVPTYKVDAIGAPIVPSGPSQRSAGARKTTGGSLVAGSVQLPPTVRPKAVDDAFARLGTPSSKPVVVDTRLPPGSLYAATPLPPPPIKSTDPRLPKWTSDPGGDAIMSALYPKVATPPAIAAIDAAAPPLPRARPISPARVPLTSLPTVPVPVRTAPIAPARSPLPQTRTVNPMSQIVPAVQARAGQTLFGRLFNNVTDGVVPQANTSQVHQSNWTPQSTATALGVDPDHPAAIIAARTWK